MWLVRDGDVLAAVTRADTFRTRFRGLLGRDHLDGALLITGTRSVHTIGMRFPIDVAYCDRDLRVVAVTTMRPNRVGVPRWRARHVLEAEAGAFEHWRLAVGDQLRLEPAP